MATTTAATLAQKAKREFLRFLGVALYLYVCFAALLFYKATILHMAGIEYDKLGLALAKALILGKFVLVMEAIRLGERVRPGRLAPAIIWKSLLFALALLILTLCEETIVGFFHGRKPPDVLMNFAGEALPQTCAVTLLMWLIMIPYFAFHAISSSLGEGKLLRILMDRPSP